MRKFLWVSGALGALVFAVPSVATASETITYTYDARGRLVEVDHSGGPASGVKVTYEYDDVGNIKRRKVTGA